jgi:citrate lyase subunit beta/citryl-CoA lyase
MTFSTNADSKSDVVIWRSILYLPTHVDRFVDKADGLDVDAIQLDLEDSVPLFEKERARSLVKTAAAKVRRGGADVIVRINRPIAMAIQDIEASVCPDVCALNLPKVLGADHVRLLCEHLTVMEARAGMQVGTIKLIVTIETPDALLKAREICAADPRIVGAILGGEDFAAATGARPDSELLESAKKDLIIAATAAGVMPFGTLGSIANYRDVDAFRKTVERSRSCGYRGSTCIHPDQAVILNAEFMPSAQELDWAASVVAGFGGGEAGAVGLNGEMVDLPVFKRAQSIITWKERLDSRQALRTLAPAP